MTNSAVALALFAIVPLSYEIELVKLILNGSSCTLKLLADRTGMHKQDMHSIILSSTLLMFRFKIVSKVVHNNLKSNCNYLINKP